MKENYFKLSTWERNLEEKRLWYNTLIAENRRKASTKKKEKLKTKAQELVKGIKKWVYLKKGPPPTIEVAWIIYSQLGWKGYDLEEEELWEDLPETDPLEIMELCDVIDQKKKIGLYEEAESVIPDDTLLSLRAILKDLASNGLDIRNHYYSQNWARRGKKHVGGRIQEIAARNKHPWELNSEHQQRTASLIKKTKEGKKTKKKKAVKKKSSILSSFFGIM